MRRLALLLVAAGCAGCPVAGPPAAAPPRLAVAPATHDFGRLPQGVPIEHTFTVRNAGGTPLTLIEARPGCDCTATVEGERDLAPGAAAALRVRCETARGGGPQRRTVTLYSNDPERRATLLVLTGTVALEAAAEPAQVYLGPLPPGSEAPRRVALRAGSDAVRFLAASGGPPYVRARVVDTPDGRALELATLPDAPAGAFTTIVRVQTTSPTRPALEVPVAGIVMSRPVPATPAAG